MEPEVVYNVHKNFVLDPILKQTNLIPVRTNHDSLKYNLILPSH
jgi:hypothetical protein